MKLDAFVLKEPKRGILENAHFRVDFGSSQRQREFFRKAKREVGRWVDLYGEITARNSRKFSIRMLKRWSLGQALPTADVVITICNLIRQDPQHLVALMKDSHWGQKKGGHNKVVTRGCNLTMKDRIKGGTLTGRSNSLEHMKRIASIGAVNSLKSPTHSCRKTIGARGVRMFNRLEKDTMDILENASTNVVYEPIMKIKDRRLIPDFQLGNTFIECTCDPKVNCKATKLAAKFRLLRNNFPFERGVVVTLPWLVERYRHYLPPEIDVVTASDLLTKIPCKKPLKQENTTHDGAGL